MRSAGQDFSRGPIEDSGDALGLGGVASALASERVLEGVAGAVKLIRSAAVGVGDPGEGFAHLFHAAADARQGVEDRIGGGAIGGQMRFALGGDAVEFARPLLLGPRVTDLLE